MKPKQVHPLSILRVRPKAIDALREISWKSSQAAVCGRIPSLDNLHFLTILISSLLARGAFKRGVFLKRLVNW